DDAGSIGFIGPVEIDPTFSSPLHEDSKHAGLSQSMSLINDLDDHGMTDLIIGAPGTNSDPGAVFIASTLKRQVICTIPSPVSTNCVRLSDLLFA
ncbi:MAG: hypothetical protein ACI841_004366, partial [Planctomycetota bacterium]